MLIEYQLLRNRGGPMVGTARMENGSIRVAIDSDEDRETIDRFFNDGVAIPRNQKMADGSVYWAKSGTRTWFEETVEQRLYYSAGYDYRVLTQAASTGFLILQFDESRNRRLSRQLFDVWTIRFETPSPAVDTRALRYLLSVWEQGFVEDGIIDRGDDARRVHSLLDRPGQWEVVFAGRPGVQPPGNLDRLGFDVAQWGGDFFSAIDAKLDETGLNEHGLLDYESDAEALRQWFITEVEPEDIATPPSVLEVWSVKPG